MGNSTSLDDIADAINGLAVHMDERFEQVDQRFEQVDRRFEQVDRRFEQIDSRFEQVDERFEQIDRRFGKIEGEVVAMRREHREMHEWIVSIDNRLGGLESDIAEIYDRIVVLEAKGTKRTKADLQELQTKMDRLITWATKVSRQTGIALPKL